MANEEAATEESTGPGSTTATKPRSKHGVPRVGLQTVDEYAQKIWTAARRTEVAPEVVARALSGKSDTKASGGRWRTRLTPLKLFGIVESAQGGKLKLTEIGVALANVADQEGRARALKAAALNIPAYETVLKRYDGGELPELTPIKSEFEFGWDMSAADASTVAELFVEGAKYAGLIGDDDVVRLDGAHPDRIPYSEDAEDEADEESDEPGAPENRGAIPTSQAAPPIAEVDLTPRPPIDEQQTPPPPPAPTATPSGAAGVDLRVKLDMSAWAVDDVLRVLAALGFEDPSGSE